MLRRSQLGVTILRVVTGLVFFMHGWQKLTQSGVAGTTGFFDSLGIPLPNIAAVLIIALEVLGGLALILGLATRWVAPLFILSSLTALFIFHLPNGFFVANNGYELVLLLAGASAALTLLGSGDYALDDLVFKKRRTS